MTKKDIVDIVAEETGLQRKEVQITLEAAIEKIIKSVCKDDPVTLRGFGTFRPVLRKKKLARDISRKITVEIPERYVVKFVPSDDFSEQLNYYKSKKK